MDSLDKYILKPSLAEKFSGIIWKIQIDTNFPLIAIESRNIEEHTSAISLYNFETGELHFKELMLEENWKLGLDRVHKGFVFIHGYVAEESPEHKGIIALNSAGKTLWQLFNKSLYDISREGLVAFNPNMQPRQLELLDPENGNVISGRIEKYQPYHADILVPDVVETLPAGANIDTAKLSGPVFHASVNEKNIFSFHTVEGQLFTQQLLIFQGDKLILKDFLARDIQKMNPEAFFISRNHVFYIRNEKREIVSYLV